MFRVYSKLIQIQIMFFRFFSIIDDHTILNIVPYDTR